MKWPFSNGPYIVKQVHIINKEYCSHTHAVYNGLGRPVWSGNQQECESTAEEWNTHYARYLMAKGTAAEKL